MTTDADETSAVPVRDGARGASTPSPPAHDRRPDAPVTGSAAARWLPLFARPLAADDHRAEFWVRHLRLGVVLTELTCLLGLAYVIGADRPHARLMTLMAVVVMVAVPLLLLLPMRRWSRDLRGVTVFYLWSLCTTSAIAAFCILDGGGTSPLTWLLVLTVTYAGLAYPPVGVLAMGGFTVLAHLVLSTAGSAPVEQVAVQAASLAVLSVMISWASRNEWDLIAGQEALAERLALLADTDVLTGSLNRRAFDQRLGDAAGAASEVDPLSLCMIDLDGFKRVNDEFGHAAGDALLARIASAVRQSCREADTVARLGGDEFAVLLPDTDAGTARRVGERVRRAIAEAGRPFGVTASVGVVTADGPVDGTRLLTRADRLMYDAKRAGGDTARGQHG